MVKLCPEHSKAVSCVSVEEHNFLNYGEKAFVNYIIDLYVDNGLTICEGITRAYTELQYVQSLLN